jgi:hypothetical protein
MKSLTMVAPKADAGTAEDCFKHALVVGRQQQAKWELRAAMSLARLWRDQGKVQQARELLAPVYGWFTEGFDTSEGGEAVVGGVGGIAARKANDDGDLLWRYFEEVGRLCIAKSKSSKEFAMQLCTNEKLFLDLVAASGQPKLWELTPPELSFGRSHK